MLFNSFEFIFAFLPICLLIFCGVQKYSNNHYAILWLVVSSLFFYGWWNPAYLFLMIISIVGNFYLGRLLVNQKQYAKVILILGITVNLSFLGYFKYANFFIEQLNIATGSDFHLEKIILPLAISFFTFQQIAFLVDSYRHETKEYSFIHYSLFVTFFPQLIAGPIVHHKEMLPQFLNDDTFNVTAKNITIGLSIFALGFFKKTVLADGIAPYANVVFDGTQQLSFFTAWGGALAYTFQLYFDFSGYSDMAIGLARLFGIILPLNFYSPYKALNISEFWRRWHITLSSFLRDYVYIALGGNRNGFFNRYKNLFLTMLLGGIWHGAGWNFILWGGLHGSYLVIHSGWGYLTQSWNFPMPAAIKNAVAWLVTFIAVIVGWVFFRATTPDSAIAILEGMIGLNGYEIPNTIMVRLGELQPILLELGIGAYLGGGNTFVFTWLWILILMPICLMLPNTQDLFFSVKGTLNSRNFDTANSVWPLYNKLKVISWSCSFNWSLIIALALSLSVFTLSQVSEFLYFQF